MLTEILRITRICKNIHFVCAIRAFMADVLGKKTPPLPLADTSVYGLVNPKSNGKSLCLLLGGLESLLSSHLCACLVKCFK